MSRHVTKHMLNIIWKRPCYWDDWKRHLQQEVVRQHILATKWHDAEAIHSDTLRPHIHYVWSVRSNQVKCSAMPTHLHGWNGRTNLLAVMHRNHYRSDPVQVQSTTVAAEVKGCMFVWYEKAQLKFQSAAFHDHVAIKVWRSCHLAPQLCESTQPDSCAWHTSSMQ